MTSSSYVDNKRRVYKDAVGLLEENGQYKVNNPIAARKQGRRLLRMASSKIVSVIPLTAADTSYQLNVMNDQPNLGNSGILTQERRLTMQDVFFTSSIGFFLTSLSTAYPPIHFQWWTFPSPSLGGILGLLDLSALMGIWSGNMEVKVNGEVLTPKHLLLDHCVINQTETAFASTPVNPWWDQQNFGEDGYQITDPMWIVNGGNNNEYRVTYGNDWAQVLGANNAGNTYNFAIALMWDGWLCQNASSIMNNAPDK
jgi:hypothetical protein